MEGIKFKESNMVFAQNQPQYKDLPANKSGNMVTSCWGLTWKERWQILWRGKFFFTVLTFDKPLQPQFGHVKFEDR